MEGKKISVEEFVQRGVERLSDRKDKRYGLHTAHTYFNAAIAMYYGEDVHPLVLIRDLIKKRKYLGKIVKGGIVIYDPAHVLPHRKGSFLRATKIMIESDEQRPRSHEVYELLQTTFDWTEAGRHCGGKMIFHYLHASKNVLSSRDLRIITSDSTSLTLMVRVSDGTCFTYKIMVPHDVTSHIFCSAVQHAINSRDEWSTPYTVHVGAHKGGQRALRIILADDLVPSGGDVSVAVSTDLPKEHDAVPLSPQKSKQKKSSMSLDEGQIRKLVMHFSVRCDIEAMIPKDLFLQVAMNVLGKGDLSRGQRGRLIKFLHDHGLIVYVHNNYYAPITLGYVFTRKAIDLCVEQQPIAESV